MTSDSILPEVTLFQQDSTPLRSDQNSYVDENAVIVQYLPAGEYLVRARSSDPTAEGPYNLDLLLVPGGPPQLCAPMNLPVSGVTSGRTSITSCVWYDKTFADVYRITISDIIEVVNIAAQSDDFDSSLVLMDGKGNILASDDSSGGGLNAQIGQTLVPGSYYVIIKPADDPTSSGRYTLNVSAMAAP